MNRLARNFTSGFSIQLFLKMMKSKNNKRCTPETMRNAFAMPMVSTELSFAHPAVKARIMAENPQAANVLSLFIFIFFIFNLVIADALYPQPVG